MTFEVKKVHGFRFRVHGWRELKEGRWEIGDGERLKATDYRLKTEG